jgi:alkylation response protein AidB-like acyl-CoA dehydrogenase
MSVEPLESAEILARAAALAPRIREAADEVERLRRLPDALLADLTAAGVFRVAMPRAWGGPEMPPLQQIELIETLSRADASVGWCASILSDSGFYAGFLDEAVAREVYPALDARTAGMLAPVGRAERAPGGYRVRGTWAFGSGSLHADVIVGGCLVTEGGEPVLGEHGLPLWRVLVLPREAVEVRDTWRVTGLAGSGSHHYAVEDAFVPEERSFDVLGKPRRSEPLYRYHGLFFANVPGVPLGLARAALDALAEIAARKLVLPELRLLREEYRVRAAAAEAEALLGAARSYVRDVMGEAWETLCADAPLSLEQRARVALMLVHTAQSARRVVELCCDAVGAEALYQGHPLERVRRDMIAVGSHLVHQPKTYAMVGRVLLGDEPGLTFF